MFKDADLSALQYVRLDGEDVALRGLTRCFSVHEELVITIKSADSSELPENGKLVMGFNREGQPHELVAYVWLQEVGYLFSEIHDEIPATKCEKLIRFASLGGYTIAPAYE